MWGSYALPIRGELIIFIFYNITFIVSLTVPCLFPSLLPWPRADLFPSPECLTIFGIFDPATRACPHHKVHTVHMADLCSHSASWRKCATNPLRILTPVSRPTMIDSRERRGMAMCYNTTAVTAARPLTMPTVVASDGVRSARRAQVISLWVLLQQAGRSFLLFLPLN
jgi:hypothetical protein